MHLTPLSRQSLVWKKINPQVKKFDVGYASGILFRWMVEIKKELKLGIVISKRIRCSSVVRHKIKRRIRSCFFIVRSFFSLPVSVVCIIRDECVAYCNFSDLIALFKKFARTVSLYRTAHNTPLSSFQNSCSHRGGVR